MTPMNPIKHIFVLVIIFLVLGGGVLVKTMFFSTKPVVTVSGEGVARAVPKLAKFTITYVTTAASSAEALLSEKTFRRRIISLLADQYKINQSDMQVPFPQVTPQVTGAGTITYQVVNTIDVTFSNLPTLEDAISQLYEMNTPSAGNLGISNLIYTTENARDLEDQAMQEAIKDGKTRAAKLAAASGKKLGKLLSVTGQQTQAVGAVSTESNISYGIMPSANEAIPGQILLTRNATLVFELD